jgi:hypothetical protein
MHTMLAATGRRLILLSLILGTSLLAGSLAPRRAQAAVSLCRTDPIVLLSNGVVVQLTASFQLLPADVKAIHYNLRVPAGTRVSYIVFAGGGVSQLESMTVKANDAPGTYDSSSIVYSSMSGVTVSVTEQVVTPGASASVPSSAHGLTNRWVSTHVHQ